MIVKEYKKKRLTEEEKKAVSLNLGHTNIGTTFGSYGHGYMDEEKQIDIIKNLKIDEEEEGMDGQGWVY